MKEDQVYPSSAALSFSIQKAPTFFRLEFYRPRSLTGQVLVHRRLMSQGFGLIFNVRKEQREPIV